MKQGSSHFNWVIVGITFITLGITYSTWYSFSVFFVALLKEFGWDRSTAAAAFSFYIIVHGVAGPFVGKLADRFGTGKVFLLGSLFLGGGLAACSLIQSHWQLYLFFGFFTAIGVGATGWIPSIRIVQQWFQGKLGLPIGIISAGVGIGILIYVPAVQYLITLIGWRKTYLVMAFFVPLVIASAAVVFIRRPPPIGFAPAGTAPGTVENDPLIVDEAWASRDWTLREAAATKQFWYLCFLMFFANFAVQAVLAHQVAFFVDQGLSIRFAAYIVGMIGVISIAAKILWATLSDRFGREATYTIGMGCSVCGLLILILFAHSPSPYLPYLYALSFGMGYASTASLPPLIIADFFSGTSFGTILGTFWIPNGLGAACGVWFAGLLFDQNKSYVPVFIIMIACILFACFSIWKAGPRKIRLVPGSSRLRPRLR
jgi:MFS family permease